MFYFLRIKNKELAHKLLQGVRDYFKTLPFMYLSDSQVRIISGPEEGIFAFLASNYIKKEFPLVNNYFHKIKCDIITLKSFLLTKKKGSCKSRSLWNN